MRSPMTSDANRAERVSTVWTTIATASPIAIRLTVSSVVPSATDWISEPTSQGAISPATAAAPCSDERPC